jgi:hypothetical protein
MSIRNSSILFSCWIPIFCVCVCCTSWERSHIRRKTHILSSNTVQVIDESMLHAGNSFTPPAGHGVIVVTSHVASVFKIPRHELWGVANIVRCSNSRRTGMSTEKPRFMQHSSGEGPYGENGCLMKNYFSNRKNIISFFVWFLIIV